MLAELGFYLLLAVTLLGPDTKAQAMKGKSFWGQAGTGRGQKGDRWQWDLKRSQCEKAGDPFGGSWLS